MVMFCNTCAHAIAVVFSVLGSSVLRATIKCFQKLWLVFVHLLIDSSTVECLMLKKNVNIISRLFSLLHMRKNIIGCVFTLKLANSVVTAG